MTEKRNFITKDQFNNRFEYELGIKILTYLIAQKIIGQKKQKI